MSVRDSYHVLCARRADLEAEKKQIESVNVLCRNMRRLSHIINDLIKVNREIRFHEINDKRRTA